jgi:hypothetical protein
MAEIISIDYDELEHVCKMLSGIKDLFNDRLIKAKTSSTDILFIPIDISNISALNMLENDMDILQQKGNKTLSDIDELITFIHRAINDYHESESKILTTILASNLGVFNSNNPVNTSVNGSNLSEWDKIKQNFSEGSTGYKVLKVGKACVGIGLGAVVIAGSGILEVTSLGTLTVATVAGVTVGSNSILNGFRDLWDCGTGQFDKAGTQNLLRDESSFTFGKVGGIFHQEKTGEFLGETAYYVADIRYSLPGIKKAFEAVKALDYVKTTCFKQLVGNNLTGYVERPVKLLIEANPGIRAKVMSSYKLISNAKETWDRGSKLYQEVVPQTNIH